MPFARPSLTELRAQVAQDIASALPGSDPLLRFSNLRILGEVQAGLAHEHNGYLDYIAQQSVPFTATGENLESWAALKRVYRIPASVATGTVIFTGADATAIPAGTALVRGDGQSYVTTSPGSISGGSATLPVAAVADPSGLTGAAGNCDAGVAFTVETAIAGLTSTCYAASNFRGGADLESNDALRARMLLTYQNPPHGGDATDYVEWALSVPGVTRAWCVPNAMGIGTVGVYVMFDAAESAHDGFPQGMNGVSQYDPGPGGVPRDVVATGDQLAVADAILPLQPVTALVYVFAPVPLSQNFTIANLSAASTETKSAVQAAIAGVLRQYAQITATASSVDLSYVESAIAGVPGTAGFVITSPTGNIVTGSGSLPVLGTVTFS